MRKLSTALCAIVMLSAALVSMVPCAGAAPAPRTGESCNAPVWNNDDSWSMNINFNPDTTIVDAGSGITVKMTNYQETTAHTMIGTRMYGGHNCYILRVYSNYTATGTWDMGGFGGGVTDKGSTVGEQYQRISDLSFVGSDFNMSGNQTYEGVPPQAYTVRAITTTNNPTTYFQFPLTCTSPNQTWHTSSVQTTQITGTVTETQTNTFNFDSYVEEYGQTTVTGGTFTTFRIRNAGTWDRTIGSDPQPTKTYNGDIYYAPEVKHEVKDTNIGMTVTSYYMARPKPDLAVTQSAIFLNMTPTIGKAVTINANITNKVKAGAWMGNATDFSVRFFDGNNQIDTDQTHSGNLTPGCTTVLNVSWTPATKGTHTIRVTVDPDALVEEWDKTNNEATLDVNVLEPAPDLTLSANDINVPPDASIDRDTKITATVHNIGSLAASTVSVRFYDGAVQIGAEQSISSIPIDGSGIACVTWRPLQLGAHTIRVKIDEFNAIKELSDTNNEAAIQVMVGQLPYAFTMTLDPDSLGAVPGGPAVFTVTVHNAGSKYDTVNFQKTAPPADWTATFSKTSLGIASGANDAITLSVTPPAGTRAGTTANVTVTGISQGNATMKGSVTAMTTVNHFAGASLNLTTPQADLHGLPGDTNTYTITLKNTGNDRDSFDLSVDSQKSWTTVVVGDKRTPDLSPDETYKVKVSTSIPATGAAGDRDVMTLTVKSRFNVSYTEELQAVTTVDAVHDLSVSVSPAEVTADPGTSARYTVKITNNGNGREVVKLYLNSSPELPTSWTVSMDSSADIAAGKDRETTISISVKEDALAKTYALSLDVVGGNTTVTKTLTLIVKHIPACSVEALIAFVKTDAGKTVTFSLTVKNEGNGEDTLTLSTIALSPSWTATFLDSSSVKVPAKNEQVVTLTVRVPAGASGDTSFQVHVKSGKDTSKTDTVLLTISVKAQTKVGNDWLLPLVIGIVVIGAVIGGLAFALTRRKKPEPAAKPSTPVDDILKDDRTGDKAAKKGKGKKKDEAEGDDKEKDKADEPKEDGKAGPAKCPSCGLALDPAWSLCPECNIPIKK